MARINIEDSIYKDFRFYKLVEKSNSVDEAIGSLIRAWSLAQQFYLNEETSRLIPKTEWKRQSINNSVIDAGLAEVRGEYVYVLGSDDQFAWLLQRQEAGKKGGRPPNRNKRIAEKAGPLRKKAGESGESGSNPLSLSLSLSPTLSQDQALSQNSNTSSHKKTRACAGLQKQVDVQVLIKIWEDHSENLPKIRECVGKRMDKAKAALKKHPDPEFWIALIKRVAASTFCQGGNETGWKADFDWILQDAVPNKILEGKYDNRTPSARGKAPPAGAFQRKENADDELNQIYREIGIT